MTKKVTTEQLAQRIVGCGLVTNGQLNELYSKLGTKELAVDEFQNQLLRHELVTNYQMERIMGGHTTGFFYGDYKVLYIVGAGTFARVYRAVHKDKGDVRAVKVLRQRYAADVDTRSQFESEARTVMTLRHPNICPIYEVSSEGHRLYMIMEFVEGQNLRDYVNIHGKLNILTALNISKDIISGLEYAFAQGINHRDLKLSNVLLSSKGRAMIVDFGLAADHDKKGEEGFNPRAIDYAGLERASKVKRHDKRSDIFFWGGMLYHMICGKPAMSETRDRSKRLSVERFAKITPIQSIDPTVPHRVAAMLHKAMAFHAKERLQNPTEALREINAAIDAIERGETDQYDEKLAEQEKKEEKQTAPEEPEGKDHTLMLIESHGKIQNALREALKKVGYKVLIYNNPRRALTRFSDLNSDGTRAADCVLFGCGQIGVDCLDAFNYFAENEETADYPAILITDETQAHFKDQAQLAKHRGHLEMPIRFRELRRMLRKVLKYKVENQ